MTTRLDLAATNAYRLRTRRLLARGSAALLFAWRSTPDVGEDAEERFAQRATPVLAGLGALAGTLTAGYIGTLTAGDRPATDDLTIAQDLRHPFVGLYRELSRGTPFAQAIRQAEHRAATLAQERVIQTQRAVADRADELESVVGWRRVPQGSTCKWCVDAADQRYISALSASFGHGHGGVDYCDCDVTPIIGDRDPGRVLNRPLISAARATEADTAYLDADAAEATERPEPVTSSPAP